MADGFQSPDEFKDVVEKAFGLLNGDEELGPKLKAADTPHRFDFSDLELVAHVRPTRGEEEGHLVWTWGDADWEPRVRMAMTSETLNRFLLGQENVAVALADKRIKTGGDVKAALALFPLYEGVFAPYRALAEAEYPHLVA